MIWNLGFLLLVTIVEKENSVTFDYFDNYREAYHAAEITKKPMLVILNPTSDSDEHVYSPEDVAKTQQRRELLENYVVAIVSTDTKQGRATQQLFRSPQLPRVVVIDKGQEFQVFQARRLLQGEDWNRILEAFLRDADRTTSFALDVAQWCPT